MMNKKSRVLSLLVLAAISLTGCAFSPLAKRSAAFGNAASAVVRNTSTGYDTIQRTTIDVGVSSLVLDFDKSGFDRDKIKPCIPEHDLEIRQQVLQGLQKYSDDLADTASDHAFASIDDQSQALSKQLTALSTNADLKKIAPNVTVNDSEAKGLSTAIDTLARVLVERKRRKELPKIIAKMQPVLEQICHLLDEDIGNKPVNGQGGNGLRGQLWDEYDAMIVNQITYIRKSSDKLAPAEKKAEISKLPDLVQQQQAGDAALAATQKALRDLPNTHKALLAPDKSGNTFKERLQVLIADGQQIGNFYSKLQSK
jgi:hypothetical protein